MDHHTLPCHPQFCANCALRSALPVWFLFSVEWHCIKAVANNHKLRIRGLPCLKFVKMREFSETFKIRKKIIFSASPVTAKFSNSHNTRQPLNVSCGQLKTPILTLVIQWSCRRFVDFVKAARDQLHCWPGNE